MYDMKSDCRIMLKICKIKKPRIYYARFNKFIYLI